MAQPKNDIQFIVNRMLYAQAQTEYLLNTIIKYTEANQVHTKLFDGVSCFSSVIVRLSHAKTLFDDYNIQSVGKIRKPTDYTDSILMSTESHLKVVSEWRKYFSENYG